jgi:hypothetical protein
VPTTITGRLKFGQEHRRRAGYCIASFTGKHICRTLSTSSSVSPPQPISLPRQSPV